jgi:two-component system sensor histidine kinase RegB
MSHLRKSIVASLLPHDGMPASEIKAKIQWLTRMRWVAIFAQIVSFWLGARLGLLEAQLEPIFCAVVAFVSFFNFWVLRTGPSGSLSLLLHMMTDLACLTGLLCLTGGCANPLMTLIFMHAALGPILLSGLPSVLYLGATCVSLASVCYVTPLHSIPHLNGEFHRLLRLFAEILVVCAIWGFTTWLVRTLTILRTDLALAQRCKQRSEHLRALGAMASGFSHEFATPLNTAKIRLERALRHQERPAPDAELKVALEALDQCESVLRGLYGKQLVSGAVLFTEINLCEFVERICQSWQCDHSDIQIEISAAKVDTEIRCRAPQIALSKTLLDLLDNASNASQEEHHVIQVAVGSANGKAQISISDRGRGIAEALRDRIGEPFITGRLGGTGLGLYTANGLMDALGGLLEIFPRHGGGTTVMLSLPCVTE